MRIETTMSESIKNLAEAQVKVQKEIEDMAHDSKGYGYNYTSYDALVKYLRPLLTKHGISFVQMPVGSDAEIGVETLYMHTSGEWVRREDDTDCRIKVDEYISVCRFSYNLL